MKKKYSFLAITLLLIQTNLFCQQSNSTLVPYRLKDKWGYSDTTGKIVIIPKFDDADFFYDTIARVRLGEEWRLINNKGNYITNVKFSHISQFSNGLATARLLNAPPLYGGLINTKGEWVVMSGKYVFPDFLCELCSKKPLSYEGRGCRGFGWPVLSAPVDEDFYLVKTRWYGGGQINTNEEFSKFEKESFDPSWNMECWFEGYIGVIDKYGKEIVSPSNHRYIEYNKERKLFIVTLDSMEDISEIEQKKGISYKGIYDSTGTLIYPYTKCLNLIYFNSGMFILQKNSYEAVWTDISGNVIDNWYPPKNTFQHPPLENGILPLMDGMFFITPQGKFVNIYYDQESEKYNDNRTVRRFVYKFILTDSINNQYDFKECKASVKNASQIKYDYEGITLKTVSITNRSKTIIISIKDEYNPNVSDVRRYRNEDARLEKMSDIQSLKITKAYFKYEILDRNGKVFASYDSIASSGFKNGYAAVVKNGQVGIIDTNCRILIPFKYSPNIMTKRAETGVWYKGQYLVTKNRLLVACLNNKHGIIDLKDNVILPLIYDYVEILNDSLATICLDKKFGVVNYKNRNKIIVPIIYDEFPKILNNLIILSVREYPTDGMYGVGDDRAAIFLNIVSIYSLHTNSLLNFNGRSANVKKYNNNYISIGGRGYINNQGVMFFSEK